MVFVCRDQPQTWETVKKFMGFIGGGRSMMKERGLKLETVQVTQSDWAYQSNKRQEAWISKPTLNSTMLYQIKAALINLMAMRSDWWSNNQKWQQPSWMDELSLIGWPTLLTSKSLTVHYAVKLRPHSKVSILNDTFW